MKHYERNNRRHSRIESKDQQIFAARQGKVILIITDRGKPIGRIEPVAETLNERVQRLVKAGIMRWNSKKLEPPPPAAINRGDKLMSNLVSEDREIGYLP